jgi:hypothetical protein
MIATANHAMSFLHPWGRLVLVLLISAAIAVVAWARSVYWYRR